MTTAKVRDLSKFGVITDVDPYNLPPQAFSMAVNARFKGNTVYRAPVFRRVPVTLSQTDPRFVASNAPSTGSDTIYIGYLNGRVTEFVDNVETDVSVFGYANASAEVPYTSCHLGDVFYVNRSDRVPWKRDTSDTIFENLANWDTNWRAKILRSCSGALCAFGITESSTTYPTMIRTSEFAEVNTVPSTWDATDPTTNATRNILGEMEGGITDALNLGEGIIIYGLKEAWSMQADSSQDVWRYDKLPFDAGCISTNCVVEVGGQHFVFGLDDIWRHDGVSKQSICDGRVRRFIFENMNLAKSHRFYVAHDRARKEIRFCYVSGDAYTAFTGVDGCNRCAVYNIAEDTWTFDDLPNTYGAATSNLDVGLTWSTVTQLWETIGGSWLDQEDTLKKALVMVGDVNATYSLSKSLYAVDEQGPGSIVPYAVDTNATQGVTLLRDGIDLDELPDVKDLRGYKVASSIFPQARLEDGASPLSFSFGSADNYNQTVVMSDPQTYDGDTLLQCDFNQGGRYLSMLITHDDFHWFKLTGFDLDLYVTGEA